MAKSNIQENIVPVLEMSCAVCAANVENTTRALPGVLQADVNFASNDMHLVYDRSVISLEEIQRQIRAIGYDILIGGDNTEEKKEEKQAERYRRIRLRTLGAWALAIPLMVISMVFMDNPYAAWVMLVLTLPILYFGRRFFINAVRQARHGSANMDTLVALSVSVAFLYSLVNTLFPSLLASSGMPVHVYYEASGMIIAFVLLGKLLEERAKGNTSSAIRKLMGLQPKTARIVTPDGEKDLPIGMIRVGDRISVRRQAVTYSYKVLDLVSSRQPAKNVPVYCLDITPQEELDKLNVPRETIFVFRDRGTGRPTKKERRELDDLMEAVLYDDEE